MKKNMGTADKIVRILLAIAIGALYFAKLMTGTTAIMLLILAVIFITTSFIGFCPLYYPFGISTCKTERDNLKPST